MWKIHAVFCAGFWPDGYDIGYAGAIEVNAFVFSGIYKLTATMSDEANAKGDDMSMCSLANDVQTEGHTKVRKVLKPLVWDRSEGAKEWFRKCGLVFDASKRLNSQQRGGRGSRFLELDLRGRFHSSVRPLIVHPPPDHSVDLSRY